MTSKSSYVVLAVNTVVLVCVVGWVLVQTGHAPREPPGAPSSDAGLRAQLDEVERRNEYLDQRVAGLERTTSEMRDLLESMRDRRGPTAAPVPVAPTTEPKAATPDAPLDAASMDPASPTFDPSRMTDEQLRAARVRQIQDRVRADARRDIPARLVSLASTDEKVIDKRRLEARLEGRQMAIALGTGGDEADKLVAIFVESADREASEVGPLVRDGIDRADLAAVGSKLGEGWLEMDRRAKDALGDEKFSKYSESIGAMRSLTREVLAGLQKR
ncbi:MAG: hypothetical protein K8T90_09560 [Planctomycetes bacterium]|nr:hypothetical protein [Planctomycetota bacterium]